MGKFDEALKDYLRGLLECSYYDLTGGVARNLTSKSYNLHEFTRPE